MSFEEDAESDGLTVRALMARNTALAVTNIVRVLVQR